jgi:hypothetical protein
LFRHFTARSFAAGPGLVLSREGAATVAAFLSSELPGRLQVVSKLAAAQHPVGRLALLVLASDRTARSAGTCRSAALRSWAEVALYAGRLVTLMSDSESSTLVISIKPDGLWLTLVPLDDLLGHDGSEDRLGSLSPQGKATLREIAKPLAEGYSPMEVARDLKIRQSSLGRLVDELRAELVDELRRLS